MNEALTTLILTVGGIATAYIGAKATPRDLARMQALHDLVSRMPEGSARRTDLEAALDRAASKYRARYEGTASRRQDYVVLAVLTFMAAASAAGFFVTISNDSTPMVLSIVNQIVFIGFFIFCVASIGRGIRILIDKAG